MTAHNDKLGVNWKVDELEKPGYVLDTDSKHFKTNYTEFVAVAVKFLRQDG